jgi:glutamate-1-semialdehyde 2,1-aminomutase
MSTQGTPTRQYRRSAELLKKSRQYLVGGVSSLVRAEAKPQPLFFRSASGSHLTDVDGNRYVDYSLAWGPLILGHSHPAVVSAVSRQLRKFQVLGGQHELEISVARRICQMVPCAGLVTFSSTGSDPVQMALRLARAYTGRQKFIKFEGHYHGWPDNVLLSFHPKVPARDISQPVPGSEGQSNSVRGDVLVLPWNDSENLKQTVEAHREEIAAIITEPILCNSSCLMPHPGYLEGMRELASRFGIVLIFDEVITGFRVSPGGAQSLLGVTPDLATFGKAVAAGFALSVLAGKREIMDLIAQRRVLHGGTFNGNPISLAAADSALKIIAAQNGSVLKRIERTGRTLMEGIKQSAADFGIPLLINGVGAVFHLSFTNRREMHNYRDTLECDIPMRDQFIQAMLQAGVYLLPDGRWYVSAAVSEVDVKKTLDVVHDAFSNLKHRMPAGARVG